MTPLKNAVVVFLVVFFALCLKDVVLWLIRQR